VVSGGYDDATVPVWDLATGQPLDSLTFPTFVSALPLRGRWLLVGFGGEVAAFTLTTRLEERSRWSTPPAGPTSWASRRTRTEPGSLSRGVTS
jgi:hypothetical protein